MNTWAPLWNGIVESSIWDEPDHVLKVFLTMLAVKDWDHIVRCNAYQLSRKSRKTELEVLDAIKVLSSPDTKRIEPQEHDGRRIMAVEDGWLILNGGKYRDMVQKEMKKLRDARASAAYRKRQKEKKEMVPGQHDGESDIANKRSLKKIHEKHAVSLGRDIETWESATVAPEANGVPLE